MLHQCCYVCTSPVNSLKLFLNITRFLPEFYFLWCHQLKYSTVSPHRQRCTCFLAPYEQLAVWKSITLLDHTLLLYLYLSRGKRTRAAAPYRMNRVPPVQVPAVLKVLRPVASFDVFDDVGLEELPEQLQSLVARHLGPKVVVAPQQLVQIVHGLGSREAALVVAEVRPVPPQRHSSAEQFNGFIPLREKKDKKGKHMWRRETIGCYGCCGAVVTESELRRFNMWYIMIINNDSFLEPQRWLSQITAVHAINKMLFSVILTAVWNIVLVAVK